MLLLLRYTMLIDARWCISLESWGKFLHVQLEMTKVVHSRKNCRTWRRRLKEKSNLLRMASWLEDMELWGTSFRKKSAAERRGWTRAKMCSACACVVQPCRIYCECLLFVGFERLLFLRSRQSQVLPVQCQRWSQPPSTWWHLHLFGLIVCMTRIALTSYINLFFAILNPEDVPALCLVELFKQINPPETKWWNQQQTCVDRCTWSTSTPPGRMKWKRGQFERASRRLPDKLQKGFSGHGWSWRTVYVSDLIIIWFLYKLSTYCKKDKENATAATLLVVQSAKGCEQLLFSRPGSTSSRSNPHGFWKRCGKKVVCEGMWDWFHLGSCMFLLLLTYLHVELGVHQIVYILDDCRFWVHAAYCWLSAVSLFLLILVISCDDLLASLCTFPVAPFHQYIKKIYIIT